MTQMSVHQKNNNNNNSKSNEQNRLAKNNYHRQQFSQKSKKKETRIYKQMRLKFGLRSQTFACHVLNQCDLHIIFNKLTKKLPTPLSSSSMFHVKRLYLVPFGSERTDRPTDRMNGETNNHQTQQEMLYTFHGDPFSNEHMVAESHLDP